MKNLGKIIILSQIHKFIINGSNQMYVATILQLLYCIILYCLGLRPRRLFLSNQATKQDRRLLSEETRAVYNL